MLSLVSPGDFPVAQEYTYLNAAAIAPLPEVVSSATIDWQRRIGMQGTVHLDEEAEASVFDARAIDWAPSARRFEFGTIAYGGTVGLPTAIDYLLGIGIDEICSHNLALAGRLVEGLADMGGHLVSPSASNLHSSIVTVQFRGHDHVRLARRLFDDRVVVSPRMGSLPIAPHPYNTAHDIDRALEALESILAEEERTGEKR